MADHCIFSVMALCMLCGVGLLSCAEQPESEARDVYDAPVRRPLHPTDGKWTLSAEDLQIPPTVLEPDLEISGSESGLVWVADVAGLKDGSLLVLDRMARKVFRWSAGHLTEIAGGHGSGPGEFSDPVALAVTDTLFGVLDRSALRIAWFRTDGGHVATQRLDEPGDLQVAMARGPTRGVYSPYYGHVDFADRFHAGEKGAVLEIEDNELERPAETDHRILNRKVHLVAIPFGAASPDTIQSWQAPPLVLATESRGGVRATGPPLYYPSLVWHSGGTHLATIAPETGVLELRALGQEQRELLSLVWPSGGAVTARDRVNAHLWALQRWSPHLTTAEARERYNSEEARQEYAERMASTYEYWDERPSITEVLVTDSLFWVSEFSSGDSPEGIAMTWSLLDPERIELVGRVRFLTAGELLRDVTDCFAYTTNVDDEGLFIVRRYALPEWACA